jgi:hypothetical protein
LQAERKLKAPETISRSGILDESNRRTKRYLKKLAEDRDDFDEDDIEQMRKDLLKEYKDVLQPTPPRLPPKREIEHEINIIDPTLNYKYRLPKCPESLKPAFMEKLNRYVEASWWIVGTANQAAPMLCIRKPDGRLRTVVDCRARNANTRRDVTPFPDQDAIIDKVARANHVSKLDLADAYEQIRVRQEHVEHTAFATPVGTYLSQVMQQGDCNAPATFQRLMTHIFRKLMERSTDPYMDDVFLTTERVKAHYYDLREIFEILRKEQLYLNPKKVFLFVNEVECLGHVIKGNAIYPARDKLRFGNGDDLGA